MTKAVARHDKKFKTLEELKPDARLVYLSSDNGNAICSVDDPYHNWFVQVPKGAFDSVAVSGYAIVRELIKYKGSSESILPSYSQP